MHIVETTSDIARVRTSTRPAPRSPHAARARTGTSPAFTRIAAQTILSCALLAVAGVATGYAQDVDPPGFAPISLTARQVLALNVTCFDHQVGDLPPGPCRGELMFHDDAGRELERGSYELQPGESMTMPLTIPASHRAGERIRRVLIVPCIIPAPGGRAIPSVEVFDREEGRVIQFANPATARMSSFNNDPTDRGSEVGFDPQPDPPGFGMATLRGHQTMRMNVACFDHPVNGFPPGPCRGDVMFHDAAGNILRRGAYDLEPGQMRSFEFSPRPTRGGALVGIVPCVIPAPGGRAVPSVEVTDGAGNVALVINPAVARMSQFQQQELPR